MRRGFQLLLGVGFAVLFIWLTLRQLDLAEVIAAAKGINPLWLAMAPLILAVGYLFRIIRWRMMLLPHNPQLGMGRSAVAFVASIAVNNLLPFRAGDVLRCFGFSGWLNVPAAPLLATVVVERLLDLSVLLLALALALWIFVPKQAALGLTGYAIATLTLTGVAALLLLVRPQLLRPVVRALVWGAGKYSPAMRSRADAFCTLVLATLISLSGRRAMPALMGWSILVWVMEGATYWMIARSIPALPKPEAAWLAMPMGTLSTLLPSTPGHIGTFDYFAQRATVSVGNPLTEATAFVLITHIALWVPTTLAGSLCLMVWVMLRRSAEPKVGT